MNNVISRSDYEPLLARWLVVSGSELIPDKARKQIDKMIDDIRIQMGIQEASIGAFELFQMCEQREDSAPVKELYGVISEILSNVN